MQSKGLSRFFSNTTVQKHQFFGAQLSLWSNSHIQCRFAAAAAAAAAKSLQSCPTRCDPIDGSPPGSPIPGILQARTLEWVAISFSRDLPNPGIEPRSPALWADALLSEPPGKLPSLHPHRIFLSLEHQPYTHLSVLAVPFD